MAHDLQRGGYSTKVKYSKILIIFKLNGLLLFRPFPLAIEVREELDVDVRRSLFRALLWKFAAINHYNERCKRNERGEHFGGDSYGEEYGSLVTGTL